MTLGRVAGLLLCLVGGPAGAEVVIHVPADQATLTAAVTAVPNGGTIELAAGSYASPAAGFAFSDLNKAFTLRGAAGAAVYLDGGSARPVLRIENTNPANGRPIVFENLTFRNGSSSSATVAGGVSIKRGEATFIDCVFDNNQRYESSGSEVAGGGVGVAINARAFFIRALFTNNRVKNNGGGLSVSSTSTVFVHDSRFIGNRADVPAHRDTASGGAISVINSRLFVTNSRFEANRSGYVGGAIMALGSWVNPVTTPSSEVVIANSTFVENQAFSNGVTLPGPSEAGAVHAEDQTTLRIFHSRFVRNAAETGGAVNLYRAIVEVDQSVLIGNRAASSGSGGFGGTFNVLSNDTSSVDPNRRSGSLTVSRSFVRGTDAPTVTVNGKTGGCLAAAGDFTRRMGIVTPQGNAASTRASVTLSDVVFDDCEVASSSNPAGGAFDVYLTSATFADAMVIRSGATGSGGSGGGGRLTSESTGSLTNLTFARNVANSFAGGLWISGSSIDIGGSRFTWNEISPGTAEAIGNSYGAGLFAAGQSDWPTSGAHQNQTGTVSGSVFSQNVGLQVFDDDRNAAGNWFNDERYNSNTFYSTSFGTDVYSDSLACCASAAELNALVVARAQGNTDKSQVANSQPGTPPVVKDLRIVPTEILDTVAAGDTETETEAFAGYAWSGGSATFDGSGVEGNAGAASVSVGSHVLQVSGQDAIDDVANGATAIGRLTATPMNISAGGSSTLAWDLVTGDLLGFALDQGLSTQSASPGTAPVSPPATTTYRAFFVTRQGGSVVESTVLVDEGTPIFFDGFASGGTGAWSSIAP